MMAAHQSIISYRYSTSPVYWNLVGLGYAGLVWALWMHACLLVSRARGTEPLYPEFPGSGYWRDLVDLELVTPPENQIL
jgi:hypothetical protein